MFKIWKFETSYNVGREHDCVYNPAPPLRSNATGTQMNSQTVNLRRWKRKWTLHSWTFHMQTVSVVDVPLKYPGFGTVDLKFHSLSLQSMELQGYTISSCKCNQKSIVFNCNNTKNVVCQLEEIDNASPNKITIDMWNGSVPLVPCSLRKHTNNSLIVVLLKGL